MEKNLSSHSTGYASKDVCPIFFARFSRNSVPFMKYAGYFFLLGMLSAPAHFASAEPYQSKINILSSIKPVQAIVTSIAGKYVNSDLLIPAYISPHDYTFKPSDIRKIQKADIVFRIDEHFETMFNSVFESLPNNAPQVISLAENPKIKLLPASGGHKHDSAEHDHADMHIFTSPKNALIMAQAIADVLSKADARNAGAYKKNLQAFNSAVHHEVEAIKSNLESVKNKSFIVFHNSWQYFGEYFGLQKPTVMELHEGVTIGVKSMMAIRKELASKDVSCVFSESTISVRKTHGITENLAVKLIEIDVTGQDITKNSDAYIKWLSVMGEQIKTCLEAH
jgi:zinc transport system substrate-binding protein